MGALTKIEWTDCTWNPIRGTLGRWHCTPVSEGCRHCYAERLNLRWGGPAYKPGADTFRLDEKILEQPLRWKAPRKIFVCDMTDLFHEDIPHAWIYRVFIRMAECPQHTFQVLTKRADRLRDFCRRIGFIEAGFNGLKRPNCSYWPNDPDQYHINATPLPNVWLGVSVEDQATADERIPLLLQTPAAVRFVSYEPALGPVDFSHYLSGMPVQTSHRQLVTRDMAIDAGDRSLEGSLYSDDEWEQIAPPLDWLIVGGESGPKARPCQVEWIRSVVQQCQAAKVACFTKQLGSSNRCQHNSKGGCWECMPNDLKVREYPDAV